MGEGTGDGKRGRGRLVSGNWKMHLDHLQAIRTVQDVGLRVAELVSEDVEVSVHPPFTALRSVQTTIEDRRIPVALGAQNCHDADQGAYTGEVSPAMLERLGVTYVIVGHSERRRLFAETDAQVAAKLRAVLAHEMTPIVCVGESDEERDQGRTEARLEEQVRAAFEGLDPGLLATLVVAYEPLWAIGTGRCADAEDAQLACGWIRELLRSIAGDVAAAAVRIQYGGSVQPENAGELLAQPDVDGALVGGASLDPAAFAAIVGEAAAGPVPAGAANRAAGPSPAPLVP